MADRKDVSSKTKEKRSGILSPKFSKRTNKIRDKCSLEINKVGLESTSSLMKTEIHKTLGKNTNLKSDTGAKTNVHINSENDNILDNEAKNSTLKDKDINSINIENMDINNSLETLDCSSNNLENMCDMTSHNICDVTSHDICEMTSYNLCDMTSGNSLTTNTDITDDLKSSSVLDYSKTSSINKLPRSVHPSLQVQQRFPLRSKLKEPTCKAYSDKKTNLPKSKNVAQINITLSEEALDKTSTAKTEINVGNKSCQTELLTSKPKLTHLVSKTIESDKIGGEIDKTLSSESVISHTVNASSSTESDVTDFKKNGGVCVKTSDYVIREPNKDSKNSPFENDDDDNLVDGSKSETLTIKRLKPQKCSTVLKFEKSTSLATTKIGYKHSSLQKAARSVKQTKVAMKEEVLKRRLSPEQSKIGKTFTNEIKLRASNNNKTGNKSENTSTLNHDEDLNLKHCQRTVSQCGDNDENQTEITKSRSLAPPSNIESKTSYKMVSDCSDIGQKDNVKCNAKSNSMNNNGSDKTISRSNTSTSHVRFRKNIDRNNESKIVNRSCSYALSRDSTSKSKSRSNSRSRSSTPNDVTNKDGVHPQNTPDKKRSTLTRKSSASSRDSSSRSRSTTPSMTSSLSDDNKTKEAKRRASKLRIPLRSSASQRDNSHQNNASTDMNDVNKKNQAKNQTTTVTIPVSSRNVSDIRTSASQKSVIPNKTNKTDTSKLRNLNVHSRSSTPDENVARFTSTRNNTRETKSHEVAKLKRADGFISPKSTRKTGLSSMVTKKEPRQFKPVGKTKPRDTSSRSRSTTPSSEASWDGTKRRKSPEINKTRRITSAKLPSDKTNISRNNVDVKHDRNILNKRNIKSSSGIPSRTNRHSPDNKTNQLRQANESANISGQNDIRTTTRVGSSVALNKSKLPLTANSDRNTPRNIPKLQKRSDKEKSQNVQSQITQCLSPSETDKPIIKSTGLSLQPSSSIKRAKISISTEYKTVKNERTISKSQNCARPENLKSNIRGNKAFVSGNKSGLTTSLSLIKKDKVSSCLYNKSEKQSVFIKKEMNSDMDTFKTISEGSHSALESTQNLIKGESKRKILSKSELTVDQGIIPSSKNEDESLHAPENKILVDILIEGSSHDNGILSDISYERTETDLKFQNNVDLQCQEKYGKKIEILDIRTGNSSESSCYTNVDPNFEVNVNCLSSAEVIRYNGELAEIRSEMNCKEGNDLKSHGSIGLPLHDLCEEKMSKFQTEIVNMRAKQSDSNARGNITGNSAFNSSSKIDANKYDDNLVTSDISGEMIQNDYNCLEINYKNDATIKHENMNIKNRNIANENCVLNNALISQSTDVPVINKYTADVIDKSMQSLGRSAFTYSHGAKRQDDKKSENLTFDIDKCDVNISQQMPLNVVGSFKYEESSDLFNDNNSNTVALTSPSGASSKWNRNKRLDKPITFDSSCVLCQNSKSCTHSEQSNYISTCNRVCQNCGTLLPDVADISTGGLDCAEHNYERQTMDSNNKLELCFKCDSGQNELFIMKSGHDAENNDTVLDSGIVIKDNISVVSNLTNDEQSTDDVTDNNSVEFNDENRMDNKVQEHNDFNTNIREHGLNTSHSRVPKCTSNIESILCWQDTFLCDKKTQEYNTDVKVQVPNNCNNNKETSCFYTRCDSEFSLSNGADLNVCDTKMDVNIETVCVTNNRASDVIGSSDTPKCELGMDLNEHNISIVKRVGDSVNTQKRYQQCNTMDYSSLYDPTLGTDVDLAMQVSSPKVTKDNDLFINSSESDLLQQNIVKQTYEKTCFHEEHGKIINAGHDRSFHGSGSSVYFMQNTGKREETSERNPDDSPSTSNHCRSTIKQASHCDENISDKIMDQSGSINNYIAYKTAAPDQQLTSPGSKAAGFCEPSTENVFNHEQPSPHYSDICVENVYNNGAGDTSVTITEHTSLKSIHNEFDSESTSNTDVQKVCDNMDHPVLQCSHGILTSQNKQTSSLNDISTENLSINDVSENNGTVPRSVYLSSSSSINQPDVSPMLCLNNVDESTDVCESREKISKCLKGTLNTGDINLQQVINNEIPETRTNRTDDCQPGKTLDMSVCSKHSENSIFSVQILDKDIIQEERDSNISNISEVVMEQMLQTDVREASIGSPNKTNVGSDTQSDHESTSTNITQSHSNLDCMTEISANIGQKPFPSRENITECSVLPERVTLTDSEVERLLTLDGTTGDCNHLDYKLSTDEQQLHLKEIISEHEQQGDIFSENENLPIEVNGLTPSLKGSADLINQLFEDQNFQPEISDGNLHASLNLGKGLCNEQVDSSECAFTENTCSELNGCLNSECVYAVHISKDCLDKEFKGETNHSGECCFDISSCNESQRNDGVSIYDKISDVPTLHPVDVINVQLEDQICNTEFHELRERNELELDQVVVTNDEHLSDVGDNFVDAEDTDKVVEQTGQSDVIDNKTKENRLSTISVNTCTSTDSFVDAVESLDDDYLTTSVIRNSKEIQHEEILSQDTPDTYDASSDISDSMDDLSGWDEFTENIEDCICDVYHSEMEFNSNKMNISGNKFAHGHSDLQQRNSSVSRIRTILHERCNQNVTPPSRRGTFITSVNDTKKLRYEDKQSETEKSGIRDSIFKTGNVSASGETKVHTIKTESRSEKCLLSESTCDGVSNTYNAFQSTSAYVSDNSTSTIPKVVNLNDETNLCVFGQFKDNDKTCSQTATGTKIETAVIKRTQRRRQRNLEKQSKNVVNVVNVNEVKTNLNVNEAIIHTNLDSSDNGANSKYTENITCTHSINSNLSHVTSDSMTFFNKTTSGNELLSTDKYTGTDSNLQKINSSVISKQGAQCSSINDKLLEAGNNDSDIVSEREASVSLTIETESSDLNREITPHSEQACPETVVDVKVIENIVTEHERFDTNRTDTMPPVTVDIAVDGGKKVITGEPACIHEIDDIEFIDADGDSDTVTSSCETSEATEVVQNKESIDDITSTPNVCVTVSLDSNAIESDAVNDGIKHETADINNSCTVIVGNTSNKSEGDAQVNNEDQQIVVSAKKSNINVYISTPSIERKDDNDVQSENIGGYECIDTSMNNENITVVGEHTHETFEEQFKTISIVSSKVSSDSPNTETEIVEESNISVRHALEMERMKLADTNDIRSRKALFESKRSGRRATIDTPSIELSTDSEVQKPQASKIQKSKSFRYERKAVSPAVSPVKPVTKDDQPMDIDRSTSPVSQKVSDICKSFMSKTRTSIQRSRDPSASKSPAPQRKLMKWVNDRGKWLRIPVDESNESQKCEIRAFNPNTDFYLDSPSDSMLNTPVDSLLNTPVDEIPKVNYPSPVKNHPPPVPQKTRTSVQAVEHQTLSGEKMAKSLSDNKLTVSHSTGENENRFDQSKANINQANQSDANSVAGTPAEIPNVMSVQVGPTLVTPSGNEDFTKSSETKRSENSSESTAVTDDQTHALANVLHHTSSETNVCITETENGDSLVTSSYDDTKVIGVALDESCDQDIHVKRKELLFGLLDSYNRRKPRKISQEEISKRCASPIGMRSGYFGDKTDEKKELDMDQSVDSTMSIPKIKAVKIQEEIYECKREYIKDNNLTLNNEMMSQSKPKRPTQLLRKSKTFSGMEVFDRQYGAKSSDSKLRNDEMNVTPTESNNKQNGDSGRASRAEQGNTKMMDKRARAGLKLKIEKTKHSGRSNEDENVSNHGITNTPNTDIQGERSPNCLTVKQPMVRMRSPDKGPRLHRSKLLSEIVEVEENKDDVTVSCDQQQRHLKDRNKSEVSRSVQKSNKRRSLSLPTGTLAFGEARVVFKNGHFTIETMDGTQIDSSRPALYKNNTRMSDGDLEDNWSMPDTSREDFSDSRMKSSSGEIIMSDQNKRPMRRQYGKAVLQSYDSSEDVFYNESEIILNGVQVERESHSFGMGLGNDDVFNESGSSRASEMSVDSYISDRTDLSVCSDITNDSNKLSSSSLPEQKDEDVKRVMQRAKRTSSFRAAQEAGALRLSGIREDKISDSGLSQSVEEISDPQKSQTSQGQNPNFLKKVMAKRKSFNENLNMSTFAKQSESAKEFFSKKMTLKGLFKKNKSDSSVGSSPLRMDHPSSPPLATFQDDDIGSVDTPPSSPYNSNREFRGRRHTSADIYHKSFQPETSETDSNCPTPTLERCGLSHLSVSSPSMPSHKSGSCSNLISQSGSHDDIISNSSIGSLASVHSTPSEQPHKPKTPKPVGASPRRNPSFGSQLSRTGSQSSQRNAMNSISSLEGMNYESFTDDVIRDPRCECNNKDIYQKSPTISTTSRGSVDSLNTLCRFCKQMDYYYKTDSVDHKQSKDKHTEERTGYKKDLPVRSNFDHLGIMAQQVDVASSNSNDSGIQRDASVHSSNESIKGVQDGHVRLRRNKSLSPHPDGPRSETSVRWADGNSGDYDEAKSPVKHRHRDIALRDRPRPKSDLEGSSFMSDRMKAFGSEINLQPYCSLRNLYEMRRRDNDKQKNRRMSTPHPIKTRLQSSRPQKLQKQPPLVRSSSMPESLEKIHKRRKMHHLLDYHMDTISRHIDIDDCMSYSSDISFDQTSLQEQSCSVQSSSSQLTSMDEDEDNLTYAEALWDHITLDLEEIGFRAQDVIQVIDMDDKDWWYGVIEDREGWFPANFVRLRVNQDEINEDDLDLDVTIQNTLMSSPKLRRISTLNKDQARSNVVNEIINAEREYVKHLKDVVEGYIQHARKRTEMFPEERIGLIFGNIETIYSFAQKFLSQLEECMDVCPHLSEIGQCFLDNEHGFEIYSDYCNNHPSACEELDTLCKNSKYKHFFEACRLLQELVEIPLEGFLLTPVQKICKYPLQLAELLKYTPPDHGDYIKVRDALATMRKIATLINERKRKMESIEKIAVWQQSVVDWEGADLLESSSELIYSGELNKINSAGWSQERFFFLFDHQLVYCKKELLKRHVFSYKGRIDLDHCEVIDLPDGKDTQYNVTVKHAWKFHELNKDKWYLVYAKTEAVKQHWLKVIKNERKRVIEDEENDFSVPDHWKLTVLNKVRSQSNIKEKHSSGRSSHGQLMTQRDMKDFTYATLPRVRPSQKHDTKKKGWFKFGTGKKSKR
ncbi:Rho guanine nucleotide exchange factor 4 [Mactra antiquata]